MFFVLRALHKSAASEAFGIPATREETVPEGLITPADVGEKIRIKTLEEMPGPSTLANLVEFFWRDGFSRIHEIQVLVFVPFCLTKSKILIVYIIVGVSQICHPCVKWHRLLRKSAPGVPVQFSTEAQEETHVWCTINLKESWQFFVVSRNSNFPYNEAIQQYN